MYKIYARSKWGTEVVDTAESKREATYLVGEYSIAYGSEFELWYSDLD